MFIQQDLFFLNTVYNNHFSVEPYKNKDPYDELNLIIPNLYITNAHTAQNHQLLRKHNIKHVISLYPIELPKDFNQVIINIYDTPLSNIQQHFENTFNFIEQHRNNNEAVLVHCHLGMSRASTIVIYYLMRKYKICFEQAYEFVKSKRSVIEPNFGFKRQLRNNDIFATKDGSCR